MYINIHLPKIFMRVPYICLLSPVMFDQYFRSFRIILCYIIIYAIYIHVTYISFDNK